MRGGISLFYEFFPAYSFHMGLFMFSSGYFYKDAAENNVFKYILKKLKRLIFPMYIWNFFYALFAQFMSIKGFLPQTGWGGLRALFIEPIISGHQYIYNLGAWFVVPLFMVEVFHVVYRRIFLMIKNDVKEYVCVIIALTFGMCGVYISSKGYNVGWWLVLARFLHFVPFYCSGVFYKRILERKDCLPNGFYFLLIFTIQLIIIVVNGGAPLYEQVWSKFTSFTFMPYIVGFLGIAFWLRITRILTPVIGKSKIINLIADNTFSIMVNQFLGFMLVKAFYACGFKYTDFLFQDFNWEAYHTDIWYYYLPKGLSQTAIIYVFVSITLSISIQLLINKIKSLCRAKVRL